MNTQTTVLPVSPTTRQIVLEYGKRAKWPKGMLARASEGALDGEPLMQAFAKLAEELTVKHSESARKFDEALQSSRIEREKLAEELKSEKAYNSIYRRTLEGIVKRAKGSFFGKGKAIEEMATAAIKNVEG